MTRKSVSRALTVRLTIVVAVLWIAGASLSAVIAGRALDRSFDAALAETAKRVLPLAVADLVNRGAKGRSEGPERVAPLLPDETGYPYVVRDDTGALLLVSADADPAVFPNRPVLGFSESSDHRIFSEAAIRGTFVIQIGEPLERRRSAILTMAVGLLSPLPILLGLAGLCIWRGVAQELLPTREVGQRIGARRADDLTPVDASGLPEEIEPLVGELNRLIARVDRLRRQERRFLATSAHELRTPIAGALAHAELLVADAPPGDLSDRARSVADGLRTLSGLAAKLLDLSRVEADKGRPADPIDLDPVIDRVLSSFPSAAGGDRLVVERVGETPFEARIDPDDFGLLLRNLVENALVHGDPAGPVEVVVGPHGLQIVNDGPVLAAKSIEGFLNPFERGSRSDGAGLGLSIVDAVARAGALAVHFQSPAPGRDAGVAVTVSPDSGSTAASGPSIAAAARRAVAGGQGGLDRPPATRR